MFSCAISDDGSKAVIGGHAPSVLISMVDGATLNHIGNGCFFAGFVPNSTDVIFGGKLDQYEKVPSE